MESTEKPGKKPPNQICEVTPSVSCGTDEVFRDPSFHLNTMNVMLPFSFKDWLDRQRPALAHGGPINMFGAQFETEVAQIPVHQITMQHFEKDCIPKRF